LIIAENLRADISEVMSHPVKKDIEAVAFTYDRKQWKILNISVALDRDYLGAVADGEINVVDKALDDRHWIVVCLLDNGPVKYYHYDRGAEKATFLFSLMSKREGSSLAKMHPVIIKSRDGLNLVSHYSPPVWSNRRWIQQQHWQ
jgi:dipeptidyl aminopeptidase/acylaminoacyl peptidase